MEEKVRDENENDSKELKIKKYNGNYIKKYKKEFKRKMRITKIYLVDNGREDLVKIKKKKDTNN